MAVFLLFLYLPWISIIFEQSAAAPDEKAKSHCQLIEDRGIPSRLS